MIAKLKTKLIGTEEKKRLASNIFSLGLLQGASYILPLLTMPYLFRILGAEFFGLLAFSTATIMYFTLITNYGFNLSATRQVSIFRDNKIKIAEVYSAVMVIKFILMLISFMLLTLFVFSVERFNEYWEVYFISFGIVVGQVFFPVWLFQGMEKMKHITYLNVFSKIFFTVCIFTFVNKPSDYLMVPAFTSMGSVMVGFFSIYLIRKQIGVSFIWPSNEVMIFQLKEGWYVFFSNIAISLYTISTVFILGLFSNNLAVAYFSSADKIVQACKGLYVPVSRAVYPLISKKIYEDKVSGLKFIQRVTWVVGSGMFFVSIVLFLLAEPIVNLLLGDSYEESIIILKIMAFLPFIITLSNIFGVQTMLNLGYKKAFSYILLGAAVLGLGLAFILVPLYQGVGTAIMSLVVELFVTSIMYVFLKLKVNNK